MLYLFHAIFSIGVSNMLNTIRISILLSGLLVLALIITVKIILEHQEEKKLAQIANEILAFAKKNPGESILCTFDSKVLKMAVSGNDLSAVYPLNKANFFDLIWNLRHLSNEQFAIRLLNWDGLDHIQIVYKDSAIC